MYASISFQTLCAGSSDDPIYEENYVENPILPLIGDKFRLEGRMWMCVSIEYDYDLFRSKPYLLGSAESPVAIIITCVPGT